MDDRSRGGLSGSETVGPLADPQFAADLRRQMLRFARLQLNDTQLAEDAVQEALMGALINGRSFQGRAAFRTWVFAILKNKVADTLRQRQRTVLATQIVGEDEPMDDSPMFNERGGWREDQRPSHWEDPEGATENGQFWQVFEICLDHLPPQQARVFMMREFVGLESDDICQNAGVTLSNLNVLLHRARARLRECLEHKWFAAGEARTC